MLTGAVGEERRRIFSRGHTYCCSQTGTAKLACCKLVGGFAVVSGAAAPAWPRLSDVSQSPAQRD